MSTLVEWLASLDEEGLARVLRNRPDAAEQPEPRWIGELADRLERGGSVLRALDGLTEPCLHLAETVVALGGSPAKAELARRSGGGPLDETLAALADHALVWPGPHDRLHGAGALRGVWREPRVRAPFDPRPPHPQTAPADAAKRTRKCAQMIDLFVVRATGILAECAAAPPAQVTSTGVGARELARIAKAAACDEPMARLVLECARAAGLLAENGGRSFAVTEGYDDFVLESPGRRAEILLRAWWDLPFTPTRTRDGGGRFLPALTRHRPGPDGALQARRLLPEVLRSLPEGRGATSGIGALLQWNRPRAAPLPEDPTPFAALLSEALMLGVLALGGLTEVGEALADADASPGLLSRTVSRVLEESGRSRVDADARGPKAGSPDDGRIRLAAAPCVIHSADQALLAEIAAHRGLTRHRLRLLAPTVLLSASPVPETLAALRVAGFAPVAGPLGEPVGVERVPRPARRPEPEATGRIDHRALAARLLASPPEAAPGLTERILVREASRLPPADLRQLAHAIDAGGPVAITYMDRDGKATSRTLQSLVLDPPYLQAWCRLRQDDRHFRLSRIRTAVPVEPGPPDEKGA